MEVLLQAGLWVSQFFYLMCLLPQIMTNARVRSGTGLSELLLMGYLNSYIFMLYYLFCMGLPLAYKIFVPLQAIATVILILQRLVYDRFEVTKKLWFIYGLNIVIFLSFIPIAIRYPYVLGSVFGWFNFVVCVLNQLPQVIKIHQEKSVQGFNYLFTLFTGIAGLVETIVAVVAALPIQTFFCALRGVVFFLIFTAQFARYRTIN